MKYKWLTRCFRWKINILVILLIAIVFILTLTRIAVVVLAQHPQFVEKWIGLALKQPVRIQSMQAEWAALDPGITFNKVLVRNVEDQQSFISMKRMTVSIDIFRSLLHWRLLPGRLTIEGVNLDVDGQADHLQVRGILSPVKDLQLSAHEAAFTSLLNWMFSQGNIEIKNINVNYHDKDRKIYALRNVYLRVKNNFFRHRVWGSAIISAASPTKIQFSAKLSDIDFIDAKFNALFYLKFQNIQLKQWTNSAWLKPYLNVAAIKQGEANLSLWVSWHKTRFTNIEGQVHVKHAKAVLLSSSKMAGGKSQDTRCGNHTIIVDDMLANFIWYSSDNMMVLQASHILFSFPRQYRSPLLLKDLTAQLLWNKDDFGLHLSVPRYQFSLMGLRSHGACYLTIPFSGKPTIDFLSSYQLPHLTELSALIPNNEQHSTLSKWVDQAFLTGSMPYATVAYRGPIEAHPLRNHEAHLSAEFHIRNASMSYYFDWPILSSLNTSIEVNNRQIKADFRRLLLDGNRINQLTVSLNDFLKPVLNISSTVHTDVHNLYQFIQDSPMAVEKVAETFPLKGPVTCNLRMQIDFNQPSFPIQSEGDASVIGNLLRFKMNTLESNVHFNMNGNIDLNSIAQQFKVPLLKGISGSTSYKAMVDIQQKTNHFQALNAVFTTDMKGVTLSEFPQFFNKKASELAPVKLHITTSHNKLIQAIMHYRDDILIRLLAKNKDHHIKMLSGEIYMGQKPSSEYPVLPGFVVYGKMATFDWKTWKPFIMPFINEQDGAFNIPKIFGLPLRYVEMQFDQLNIYHQTIKNMSFRLVPRVHDWMFQMKSVGVEGVFFIPNYSGGTWAGHLDHLFIPEIKLAKMSKKQSSLKIDPRTLPPLDVEIKQLHYGNANYGHLVLRTRPNKYGITISPFSINSPLFVLKIKGHWNQYWHTQKSVLTGYFQTHDLGNLLQSWDIKDSLLHGEGVSTFYLSWKGGPDRLQLEQLNGAVDFRFRHGRILKTDGDKSAELSLGRIVNALSLEELPRWLSLHFDDITAKGLEFHVLKGSLKIKKGVCKTKDTLLDSPVAKLKISGIINLPGKYYNLNVSVSPYVTSSVPLIIGITGGPIAGAVAWLVNKIATPEIGKAIGFVYHAGGSWDTSKDASLPAPTETASSKGIS